MKHCLKLAILIFISATAPAKEMDISAPFGNTKVIATFVKPGDFVSQGQLIARLDTNDLKVKLSQLRADKQQVEHETQLTRKLLKKTKAKRAQRTHDREQAQIDANQIISGLSSLSSMKSKAVSNQQIESEIKALSSSHQKQRQLHKKLNDTLRSLTASELKLEELIQNADVKSPYDGMILDIAHLNDKVQNSHQTIASIDHA